MIQIATVVCLAAFASAEAEVDAWYHPYYNWNMMNGNNMNVMGYMMDKDGKMYHMDSTGIKEGFRYGNYGKRSADAEPEADADADAYYGPYSSNWNMNNWMSYNMYNNMNNYMYSNMNYMNRPSYTEYRTFYHKRSADAEPEAFYGPYSYSSFGYNWPRNYNYMSYMNRPYHQFSSYRYHF